MSKSSDLDRRITLQRRVVSQDPAYGSETVAWEDIATVWAKVVERFNEGSSDEETREKLRMNVAQTTVTIRWRADVETTQRVRLWDGRLLQITGMATKGRRDRIALACEQHRES